jgi:hypothetical protein
MTVPIYLALKIMIIPITQYIINCVHFLVSSSSVEKNNLYHHIIPINIPVTIINGVKTFVMSLKTKFFILSQPHNVEFASAASRCSLIGSIDLSIEVSNLHSLSTLKENSVLLFVSSVSFQENPQIIDKEHFISTVLCV